MSGSFKKCNSSNTNINCPNERRKGDAALVKTVTRIFLRKSFKEDFYKRWKRLL